MFVLGIDLGTSSVKILALDEEGNICAESSSDYPMDSPADGWAEQNPVDWWESVKNAMGELLSKGAFAPDDVKAISFSGQMHGLVSLDKDNNVLYPAILWCDQRTGEECKEITDHFGKDGLFKEVGNLALTGFTAPKILWMKKNKPDIFEKTAHILLPKDYIGFKMTGNHCTDYSDASGMLLLNVKRKQWSRSMLDFLEIDTGMLPELKESYSPVGKLTREALNELGLKGDITVVAGAGDQAAGAIGTGTVKEGIISVAMGTSGVVFAAHDTYRADPDMRLHAFCHANGKYHSMGVMLSCASCIKWWHDKVTDHMSIDELIDETATVPAGADKVIFLPYLMGERTPYPDPDARGTFIGITPNTTRNAMSKAILEGVSFGLRDTYEIIKSMGIPVNEIRAIGGGARNPIGLEILSDIFGYPVSTINTKQGGALGAAILAGVGTKIYGDIETTCNNLIKTDRTFEPDSKNKGVYEERYAKYKGLYASLKDWF